MLVTIAHGATLTTLIIVALRARQVLGAGAAMRPAYPAECAKRAGIRWRPSCDGVQVLPRSASGGAILGSAVPADPVSCGHAPRVLVAFPEVHVSDQGELKAAGGTFPDAVASWVRGIPPKRRGTALIVGSLLLVIMGTVGVLYDGNLVWINRLQHPFIFGCIAAAAFGAGLVAFIPWRGLRVLIGVASGVVVVGWFMLGLLWLMMGGTVWPVASVDAPGDREYQAVVYEQAVVIDKLWTVSIQQTRGLLSREWPAGCINSDVNDSSSIEDVRWQGPRRLLVTTDHSGILITVDPRTGEPHPNPVYARVAC
jgi:hypothetical protein